MSLNPINVLAGISASAATRYMIATAAGMASPVSRVYNVLDMLIGVVAAKIFEETGTPREAARITAKVVSFIAAALITSSFVGSVDLIAALALSSVAWLPSLMAQTATGNSPERSLIL